MNNLGKRIRNLRKHLAKSQEEFANELGVTKQAVSNMENSKSAPSISVLYKMSTNMNINLNYVISGIGDIFLTQDKTNKLKESLLKEFESMLKSRGIE